MLAKTQSKGTLSGTGRHDPNVEMVYQKQWCLWGKIQTLLVVVSAGTAGYMKGRHENLTSSAVGADAEIQMLVSFRLGLHSQHGYYVQAVHTGHESSACVLPS